MNQLVLSLFPGIGMLDMAFEEEGFCVVRGPDLLWGGDVRRFHPPAGKFDGVIGGPPCQAFSRLRFLVEHNGYKTAPDLIPEFVRCVAAARPEWFVMENVPDAPTPEVAGYAVHAQMIRDVWVGGETSRMRRFSFGTSDGRTLRVETLALHKEPEPAVCASGGYRRVPVAMTGKNKAGIAKVKSTATRDLGYTNAALLASAIKDQGLPADFFDGSPFRADAKHRMIGNGVPLPMGRAIAKAVKRAIEERAA